MPTILSTYLASGINRHLSVAEQWWVDSLRRHPVLIPYTCGLKTLDTIYLDTSFVTNSRPHRTFPSKAEGIRELLEKMQQYPKDTIFYLRAWTFGYEEVWQALSIMLESKVSLRNQNGKIKADTDENRSTLTDTNMACTSL